MGDIRNAEWMADTFDAGRKRALGVGLQKDDGTWLRWGVRLTPSIGFVEAADMGMAWLRERLSA